MQDDLGWVMHLEIQVSKFRRAERPFFFEMMEVRDAMFLVKKDGHPWIARI